MTTPKINHYEYPYEYWNCGINFIIIVVVFSCHINDFVFNCNIQLFTRLLKAAVCKFCLFVAISVWKPGIADFRGIIFLAWGWVGTAPARINLMFWGVCVSVSHRTGGGYLLYLSQILAYVLEYMTQIRIFTRYCHLNK